MFNLGLFDMQVDTGEAPKFVSVAMNRNIVNGSGGGGLPASPGEGQLPIPQYRNVETGEVLQGRDPNSLVQTSDVKPWEVPGQTAWVPNSSSPSSSAVTYDSSPADRVSEALRLSTQRETNLPSLSSTAGPGPLSEQPSAFSAPLGQRPSEGLAAARSTLTSPSVSLQRAPLSDEAYRIASAGHSIEDAEARFRNTGGYEWDPVRGTTVNRPLVVPTDSNDPLPYSGGPEGTPGQGRYTGDTLVLGGGVLGGGVREPIFNNYLGPAEGEEGFGTRGYGGENVVSPDATDWIDTNTEWTDENVAQGLREGTLSAARAEALGFGDVVKAVLFPASILGTAYSQLNPPDENYRVVGTGGPGKDYVDSTYLINPTGEGPGGISGAINSITQPITDALGNVIGTREVPNPGDQIFVAPYESVSGYSRPIDANDPNNITWRGQNFGSDFDAAIAAKDKFDRERRAEARGIDTTTPGARPTAPTGETNVDYLKEAFGVEPTPTPEPYTPKIRGSERDAPDTATGVRDDGSITYSSDHDWSQSTPTNVRDLNRPAPSNDNGGGGGGSTGGK